MEAEGVELCLIMLREGRMSKPRALRLLDHALSGQEAVIACERLIDSAGLKTVFGMFMKNVSTACWSDLNYRLKSFTARQSYH